MEPVNLRYNLDFPAIMGEAPQPAKPAASPAGPKLVTDPATGVVYESVSEAAGPALKTDPATGVQYEEVQASPAEAVRRKLTDPKYVPTQEEYEIYRKDEDAKSAATPLSTKIGEFAGGALEGAKGAVTGLANSAVAAGKELAADPVEALRRSPGTIAEGVARSAFSYGAPFRATANWIGEKVSAPFQTPEEQRALQYLNFLDKRKLQDLAQATSPQGGESMVQMKQSPAIAEFLGQVADPTLAAGGAATLAKTGLKAAAQGTVKKTLGSAAAGLGGALAEGAGKAVQTIAQAPKKMAEQLLESEGKAGPKEALKGALVGAAAEQAGAPLAKAATALKVADLIGSAAESTGSFVQKLSKTDPFLNSTRLSQIIADDSAPAWMRIAARKLNSAGMGKAGGALEAGTKGGLTGALVGAEIAGPTASAEELGQSVGSGGIMGAAGGVAGEVIGSKKAAELRDDYTALRWMASRQPAEAALLSKLPKETAVKLAGLETLMNGLSGDQGLQFRYVSGPEYAKVTNKAGTRAWYDAPSRTVLLDMDRILNSGWNVEGAIGRTPYHEAFHDLASTGIVDMSKFTTDLLGIQDAQGNVVKAGVLSPEDFKWAAAQYVQALPEPYKSALRQEQINSPDVFRARIANELGAEMFANAVEGAPSDFLKRVNGLTRRVVDAMLLREQPGILRSLGERLNAVIPGWESKASDIFFRHKPGTSTFEPLTNSPQMDALMRSIIRQKRGTTEPLEGQPLDAGTVFRPQEAWTQSGQKLVELFPDNDNWARDKQGNIVYAGGKVVLRTEAEIAALQQNRAVQMMDSIRRVASSGDPLEMRDMGNGHWVGRYFSDAQMQAIKAISPDILTDSMKEKISVINDTLKASDGSPLVFWYNAAQKNRRYSSSIREVVRTGIPFELHISKAGNFYVNTLDVSHFDRKLSTWWEKKPKFFTDFPTATDFREKALQYLGNQAAGRHGVEGLNADPVVAKRMADRINDFVNITDTATHGLVPNRVSTKKDADVLIRSRRLDRTNRLEPGVGDKMPFDYSLAKQHYSPGSDVVGMFSPDMAVQLAPKEGAKPLPNVVGAPMKLVHYTMAPITKLSPKFFGKGSATPTDLRGEPKSYTFVAGSSLGQDAAILGKKTAYGAIVDGSRIYDLDKGDPLGWVSNINRALADDAVRRKGYAGIHAKTSDGREVVMLFKDIAVTPLNLKTTKTNRAPKWKE